MRSTIIFSIVSLLAQQVSLTSGQQLDSADIIGSHGNYIATKIRRSADIDLNASGYLRRRTESYYAATHPNAPVIAAINKDVAPLPSTGMMGSMTNSTAPAGPLNLNPSMSDTQSACNSALTTATPSDDSGMAACFNINYFDNSTGHFQANVLLYKLASPSGNWTSLQAGSVHLALSFPGATAETIDTKSQTPTKRGEAPSFRRNLNPRANPTMLEAYTLVGLVNGAFNTSSSLMNVMSMREALTPMISLTAQTTNGQNLSSNTSAPAGAAFMNGWFSEADVKMREAAAAAAANPPPFMLPGVTLGFFPIGLIITSIWVGLFVGAVGFGTLGRLQWKKAYRAQKPGASGK